MAMAKKKKTRKSELAQVSFNKITLALAILNAATTEKKLFKKATTVLSQALD